MDVKLPPNPYKQLRLLNRRQWNFFALGFLAWTWDAVDFFSVSLTVSDIAATFNRSVTDITWGITVTLMLRSVGAIGFGAIADSYSRKWALIGAIFCYSIVELSTGFVQSYSAFIGVRCLFGIFMGAIYGVATSTALEDAPPEAHGILSGLLQEGYALGNLIAAAAALMVPVSPHGWRAIFWFAACPPLLLIIWRLCLPETDAFIAAKKRRKYEEAETKGSSLTSYFKAAKPAVQQHGWVLLYLLLLMSGMNFLSHGSQDLYPTYLTNSLQFSPTKVTVTTVVSNLGALTGGIFCGWLSSWIGRRVTIIGICIIGATIIPAWALVHNNGIMAAAFFEQFCVQGAWGVIPYYLFLLSPDHFKAFVVGTSYQLGNLVSSASSTIEATISERFPLSNGTNGLLRYDYGKVLAIFLACVYGYLIIVVFLGPESKYDDGTKRIPPMGYTNTDTLGRRDSHDSMQEAKPVTDSDTTENVTQNV